MTRASNDSNDSRLRESSKGSSVDHQLDALISRIQSLSAGDPSSRASDDANRPRQQPRPASGSTPPGYAREVSQSFQAEAVEVEPRERRDASEHDLASRGSAGRPMAPSTNEPNRNPAPASIPSLLRATPKSEPSQGQVVMARGFTPCRDEPWRPSEPETLHSARINETILEAIIYRALLNSGEMEGRAVSEQIKLPFRIVEPLLSRLKMEQNVAYKNSTATNDYVYILTEAGRAIARNHNQDSTYFGACPVRLQDYIQSVKLQTIEGQYPKKVDLQNAFKDLLINPQMLQRLGPAVASGRGMFLFGYPGNGKTSIAERVTGAFGKYIWIPRSIDIDGDILRVFDPMNHELSMPDASVGILDVVDYDRRWVRIKRPTIVAGGELTMDMLEVRQNSQSGISESPLQMKSNCGTLVIDDFGRQKMSVDQLLNRWIVPLEKRFDYLNMASGKKIQVPFDQLVIFSTNLEPKDLVDDAFLRRIPYKIEVPNPPEADFRRLFEIMCKVTKIPYNADAIDYVIKTHYLPVNRPFRNCQPRDLLLQVRNFCLYNDLEVELKNEYFDFACDNYFSVM